MTTPNDPRDDALDAVIKSRRPAGRPAVDLLNSAVPQADPDRRAALEQRLLARVQNADLSERNRTMLNTPVVRGRAVVPRSLPISTSLLLVAAVTLLLGAVALFSNLTPPDETLRAVAPLDQEQDISPTPTPERTATPLGAEQTAAVVPTTVPVDPAGTPTFTATPIGSLPTQPPITATPAPLIDRVPGGILPPMLESVAPRVWIPGRSSVSEREANGVMVVIPIERFNFMEPRPHFTPAESQPINLFTVVGVPPETTFGAVGEGGELAFAWVAVAQTAYLMQADENGIVVWVTLEQGIVLNWLLGSTTAQLYYEAAK